mmetsp:Transcript_12456/g.9056  ORF Transcript_12456/g.9056 Transcript_12456/m.9056 type:complete len:98 (+) Transcript_12456:209-502(+)
MESEKEKNEGLTFSPVIDSTSKVLAEKSVQNEAKKGTEKPPLMRSNRFEKLYQDSKFKKERMAEREMKLRQEQELRFRQKRSTSLQERSTPRYQKLY